MSDMRISETERKEIEDLFGMALEKMNMEDFESKLKSLRQKYHPDKFEKYEDEVVKEMASQRFKQVEKLAGKIRTHIQQGSHKAVQSDDFMHPLAKYAYDNMKIEILTKDKDLKYKLFKTGYRWLERGDRYKIPGTAASLIMEEDHRGMGIGFVESVKLYLSFGKTDVLEDVIRWLYERIEGHASGLIIEGKRIKVDFLQMVQAIKKQSFVGIEAPKEE